MSDTPTSVNEKAELPKNSELTVKQVSSYNDNTLLQILRRMSRNYAVQESGDELLQKSEHVLDSDDELDRICKDLTEFI